MKRGSGWEARLTTWHDQWRARAEPLAVIHKTHPGVRVLPSGKTIYESAGPPDYIGRIRLRSGWHSVCFDAKDSGKDHLHCSLLKPHQAADLEAEMNTGTLSFLAVRIPGQYLLLPWVAAREDFYGKAKRFNLGAAIPFSADGWLEAAEKML